MAADGLVDGSKALAVVENDTRVGRVLWWSWWESVLRGQRREEEVDRERINVFLAMTTRSRGQGEREERERVWENERCCSRVKVRVQSRAEQRRKDREKVCV
jgi:hypothetical protein